MSYQGKVDSIVFVDTNINSEVRISYKELITKPLPPFWRTFIITKHFLDPQRKHKGYVFPRDQIKNDDKQFEIFFDKIMKDNKHIITECLDTYKQYFEREHLSQSKRMNESIMNIREFVTCFSLFLAKEWDLNLGFFSIMYRQIAINLINKLYPLLIGLYICKQRNQELSVILHKLEQTQLELKELGVPPELHVNYEKAWKVLKKTKSQDIISLCEVLNYFYYTLFLCIDENKSKKVKVKDCDLSKIILYSISKAQVSQQNVHCIVNLVYDFAHGLISPKDYSVINLLHSIFSWIKSSIKIEKENDFKRYHKRTTVKNEEQIPQLKKPLSQAATMNATDYRDEHKRRIKEIRERKKNQSSPNQKSPNSQK